MIVLECAQGSVEWQQARLGVATASCFDSILTTVQRKLSEARHAYASQLLAEWSIGEPCESGGSAWTERGTEMEEEARNWYGFTCGANVRSVGFVMRDDGLVGCSPDFLVGEDGGGEIKCPGAAKHVGYFHDPAKFLKEYFHQVQGGLYVCGRKWWDLVSYNPSMPPVVVRVLPDAAYHAELHYALTVFLSEMEKRRAKMLADGYTSALDRRTVAKAEQEAQDKLTDDMLFGGPLPEPRVLPPEDAIDLEGLKF